MTIFGKQVSLAVLLSFIGSIATVVAGAWVMIVHNWNVNPTLAIGAGWTALNAVVHTWDTMPNNTTQG